MSLVSRRTVLRASAIGAAGLALAACTGGDGGPAPTAPGGPEDPDRGLRAEIGRSETDLIALYAATAGLVPPGTAAAVRVLGERHEAYRQAIDPDGLATAAPSATPTETASAAGATANGSAAPNPTTSTTAVPIPTTALTPAEAAALLRTAELSAARARVPQAVRAVDEELARVIALAGAGSAAAAEQLREGLA